jgi:hypothetical protein
VDVHGVVEDDLSSRLTEALQTIPLVRANIRSVAEEFSQAAADADQPELLDVERTAPPGSAGGKRRTLAGEDLLKQYFAAGSCSSAVAERTGKCVQEEIARFSQQILLSSEAASAEAWALRSVADWYAKLEPQSLAPSSRGLVEQMARDHLSSMRHAWGPAQGSLSAALGHPTNALEVSSIAGGVEPAGLRDAGWIAAANKLCSVVERTTALAQGMFVDTNRAVEHTEDAAAELLSSMAELDALLSELQVVLAEKRIDPSDSAASAIP